MTGLPGDDRAEPAWSSGANVKGLMVQAQAFRAAGAPLRALAASGEAFAADPNSVEAACQFGMFLTDAGYLAEAEPIFRRLFEQSPDFPGLRGALAANLLAQGRYREGWPLYEAPAEQRRLDGGSAPVPSYPRWAGETLKGKRITILPGDDHGAELRCARFLPQLLQRGAEILLLVRPPLARLFRHNFPNVDVREARGSEAFPGAHYWTRLGDLPARLDLLPEDVGGTAYLRAPVEDDEEAQDFRIGLVTRGSGDERDVYPDRSLPADLAARLVERLGGTVVPLSPEETGASDFADTAALIATVDIVVSVDTAVAHLAGAMGKSCLLMLSGFAPDWCWMRERRDSPWYRDHILYRRSIEGGWEPVIEQVLDDVETLSDPGLRVMRRAAFLRARGRYAEALEAGRRAVAAAPHHPGALYELARLLADLGRLQEAEPLQRRAVALATDGDAYRYSLGLNLLGQGRYGEAWAHYEARTRLPSLRGGFPADIPHRRWEGQDIRDKRIAILPEQGFGDQLQFARFLPQLGERCAGIVLLPKRPLVRLFETAFPDAIVMEGSGEARFPSCGAWTTLVELGRLLDVRIDALPDAQYLHLASRADHAGPFRVGLMVRGNPAYINDAHRSLPRDIGERLRAALPGEIVDLDPDATGAADFLDTARIMADLDLIVSVDTAVGHLAGAMGKPCCLLVSGFGTDWRWLHDRRDSPWYPRHSLFRGTPEGDWNAALTELTAHVHAQAAARGGRN